MENDLLAVGGWNRWVIASLLGLVWLFFYIIFGGNKTTHARASMADIRRDGYDKTSAKNGSYRTEMNERPDVIIVGAGVAGEALAYTLAEDGRRVHVIERDLSEPDRIVGELLQPGGYLKLMELGFEDCVKDIDALGVFGYTLYNDGNNTKIGYPLKNLN